MSRTLRVIVPALVCAAAGAGAAVAQGSGAGTAVAPHRGVKSTDFRVHFQAPQTASAMIHYVVTAANNTSAQGCVSSFSRNVYKAAAGSTVHVRLSPRRAWCRGRFHGRVVEITMATCGCPPPHLAAAAVCPALVCPAAMVIKAQTIGRFRFRVK